MLSKEAFKAILFESKKLIVRKMVSSIFKVVRLFAMQSVTIFLQRENELENVEASKLIG